MDSSVGGSAGGGATSANQVAGNDSLSSIDGKVATAANQTALNTLTGAVNEAAPASDTASSGLNGRLQRIAQNITSLIAKFIIGQSSSASSLAVTLSNENVQDLSVTGQAAQTATVNNILTATAGSAATDLTGYRSASVQVVSTGTSGSFIFEGSNDNVNFQAIPVYSQLILTGTPITSPIGANNSQLIYTFPVNVRYVRLRISLGIAGGSIQAFLRASQMNWTPAVFQVAQNAAANLLATVSGSLTTLTTLTTLTQLGGASVAAADGKTNPTTAMVLGGGMTFNEVGWDRYRGNTDVTLLASSARTTTQTSADIVNYNGTALDIILDMTVVGTGSVTITIDGKDTASGKYYNILTGLPVITNSTNRYRIGRTVAVAANSVAQDYLPRIFRIVVTANNANSATYSVGYRVLL